MKVCKFITISTIVICSISLAKAEWVMVSRSSATSTTRKFETYVNPGSVDLADHPLRSALISYGGPVYAYQFDCQKQQVRVTASLESSGYRSSTDDPYWRYVAGPKTNERHVFNYICGSSQNKK